MTNLRLTGLSRVARVALVFLIIGLGSYQITAISADWLESAVWEHDNFAINQAGVPMQYRVLSEVAVDLIASAGSDANPYLVLRFIQAVLLLGLAYAYYGILAISHPARLLGLACLSTLVVLSLNASTFSLDRVSDGIFYLAAGIVVLLRKNWLVVPLTLLAALNRETSGFIPLLVVAADGLSIIRERRRDVLVIAAALAVYTAELVLVRLYFGPQWNARDDVLAGRGLNWLVFVWHQRATASNFFAAMNVLPFLAVLALPGASSFLRRAFWIVVPLWVIIHFLGSWPREGLLFLSPIALILLPMSLQALERGFVPRIAGRDAFWSERTATAQARPRQPPAPRV